MNKIWMLAALLALSFVMGCADDDDKRDETPSVENGSDSNTQNPDVTPDDGKGDVTPDDGKDDTSSEPAGANDPCKDVTCQEGVCSEGICVTEAMKQIPDESVCDPETFVSFCDGNRTVYCDRGMVMSGTCEEGCAVYEETYHGRTHRRSGCVDGGVCTELNALRRSCSVVSGVGQVLATACQKTTRGDMKWISVDGYYCQGTCDLKQEKCALVEGECDPYDASNFSCDRRTLHACELDSNLQAHAVTRYCEDACIQVQGISMCGYACRDEGARDHQCVTVGTATVMDLGDFICTKSDSGALYSVWTGQYEYCHNGCNASAKVCR